MFTIIRNVGTSFREVVTDVRQDGRGQILVVVASGWFLSLGVRLVFPALLPHLRSVFDMSLTTAGLLLSVLWIAYALGQLPGGVVGDRAGEGRTLVFSALLSGVAITMIALATSRPTLFAATAAFGITTALYGTTRYTILSDVFPDRSGMAIGVTLAAGNVGNALLPAAAGGVAALVSWRAGFGLVVPLFALVAAATWLAVPDRTSGDTSAVDELSMATIARVLRRITNRSTVLMSVILLFTNFVWQGFTGFYPTYLVAVKGFDSGTASLLFGLFFLTGVLIQPLSGTCSDWLGARNTLLLVIATIAVTMVIVPFVGELPAMIGTTLLLGSLLGVSPVGNAYLVNQLPSDMQGTGLGLLRTSQMLLAASGPSVVGALADRQLFDESFLVLAAIMFLAFMCVLLLPVASR